MSGTSIRVLGTRVDVLTMDETLGEAERLIESGVTAQHVVVNAAKLVAALEDVSLRATIESCAIVNADGQAVVWASRLMKRALPERVTGIDFMGRLVDLAAKRGYRIFLLGAEPEVGAAVEQEFIRRGASVVGRSDGFWRRTRSDIDLIEEISQLGPDLIFVALPSPMKENFLAQNLHRIPKGLCVGVGGSFDIIAGRTRRAPQWMQRWGGEWLFRLFQEPRRMLRRYAVGNSKFIYYVIRELMAGRTSPGGWR